MVKRSILPVIVISQFFCTSLWFAGNAVLGNLAENFDFPISALGYLSSSVQLGFIIGTLVFAILAIADRYSPSKVFFVCALLGGLFNLGIVWDGNSFATILLLRFATGFFLAGIYPVGMKIATDYFEKGLGKSLGFLVGALVLGTALPHLLKVLTMEFPWIGVIITTSSLATLGGCAIFAFVPDGPYRKRAQNLQLASFFKVFRDSDFRVSAFGYFGHMWELYAFWTFVPLMLGTYLEAHKSTSLNTSLWSFMIIAIGSVACVIGGYLAQRFGNQKTAFTVLVISGLCCVLSPLVLTTNNEVLFLVFLLVWGAFVIADSPLFSTMVAQNAPADIKGTALTIVNCIGFSITIVSIQLINELSTVTDSKMVYALLSIGPALGFLHFYFKKITAKKRMSS